jgi:hypothetical protein
MASNNEARIIGVMAASGSGKGLWIKDLLRREKPQRLVIWDYKDEYEEHAKTLVHSLEKVRQAMLKAKAGPLQIRYKCKPGTTTKQTQAEFEGLCRLVQAWQNCCYLVEELSNVTMASWAPAAWREMTTGGRHENVFIIGVAQNPALIDNTFLSNCTEIHAGPLREFRHRQAVARSMDVPIEKITGLVKFQYIRRNYDTKELHEGFIYPPGFVPTPTQGTPTPTPRGSSKAGRTTGKPIKSGLSSDATNQQTRVPQ